MAAADPLPPAAVPLGKARADTCKMKQREQLNIALLCSKLEAHRRELEASKRKQQKRDAIHKALFVPRNAAQQFTATATPAKDDLEWAAVRWTSKLKAKRPSVGEERLHLNPKQTHAGLKMGMTENEVMAAASAMHSPNLQHLPHSGSQAGSRRGSRCVNTTQRARQGSSDIHNPNVEDADAAPTGPYKPGDSAKRRCLHAQRDQDSLARSSGMEMASVPAYRYSRDEPNEMPYDMPMPNAVDSSGGLASRPRLVSHDRPNWAQQSQCGDDFRSILRLPLLTRKSRSGEKSDDRRGSTGTRSFRNGQSENEESRRPSDSLITDAVKLIKKEERQRRRDSLMKAFFRRQ